MATAKASSKKIKKKVKKLSAEEKSQRATQRAFARQVQTIFIKSGYNRIAEASDKEFTFEGRTSDFDDVFIKENVIVCCEHTITKESNLGEHVKNKAHIYNFIEDNVGDFIKFLRHKFPSLDAAILPGYHPSQLRLRIVYCSDTEVKAEHKDLAPKTLFLWKGSIKYFKSISDTVKLSARYELNEYLRIPFSEAGEGGTLPAGEDSSKFQGTVLPEAHSNFPTGYKILSFYVSPDALLKRAYVLRKDGWKDDDGLYQRMIDREKVEKIRKYLRREERTFVNNVIVTLPDSTKILDSEGNTVEPATLEVTTPVTIQLPNRANSVGIVDGQHRIFSYYEDSSEDPQITVYRKRQNLLATGIMYPNGLSPSERSKFEAGLFLEINSTQNAAKSDLKQAIAVITAPFSHDSIGKRIVSRLSTAGALEGKLERHFFDSGVLKTTSIVSYGLRPLIRIDGEESLFKNWKSPSSAKVSSGEDVDSLLEYVSFATTQVNTFLGAARSVIGNEKWLVRGKDNSGLLTVTSVNALLILLRKISHYQGLKDFDSHRESLTKINGIDFGIYRSSQWNRMAEDMYEACFGELPSTAKEP